MLGTLKGERGDYVADWVSGARDDWIGATWDLVLSECNAVHMECHEVKICEVWFRCGPNLVSKFVRELTSAV